jgi:type I restriction enzyme S subunit
MAGEWSFARFDDFAEVKHGYAFEGRFFRDDPPGAVLVTPGNFNVGGGFNNRNLRYFAGNVPPEYELSSGDLIVTMTDLSKAGDTLGYSALVPDDGRRYLHNQRIGKVITRPNAPLSPRFAHWLLRSPPYRAEILGSATGSTVRHTSPSRIAAFEFRLPTLGEQARIANLLDALEDKIELNRRMAETLEAMGRALFKSWFVDFDPVHAKAEGRPTGLPDDLAALFPKSFDEHGLPLGWAVRPLHEKFTLTMGQSPPGSTYNDEGKGLPFYQGRTDFGFRFPDRRIFCSAPTRTANAGDTLVSVRAPVGDINMAEKKCCLGRGVAAVRHRGGSSSFTYYAIQSIQADIASFEDDGTVFGAINRKQFEALQIVDPGTDCVMAFHVRAESLDLRINDALQQIRTLTALRSTLLPRLVSGELRIADAEREVAAA